MMNFVNELYQQIRDDLDLRIPDNADIEILCLKADKLGSFQVFSSNRNLERQKLCFSS